MKPSPRLESAKLRSVSPVAPICPSDEMPNNLLKSLVCSNLTVTSRFATVAVMTRQRSKKLSDALLKIGEVARRAGVTLRTIRYYQSLGLIRAACRTAGGMHLYHPEACDRAQLIRDLRKLDVSLGTIRTLLEAERRARTGAERARALSATLSRGLAELESRIQGYLGLRENLVQALETLRSCEGCAHRPSRTGCSACENLVHFEALPVYIRALVN